MVWSTVIRVASVRSSSAPIVIQWVGVSATGHSRLTGQGGLGLGYGERLEAAGLQPGGLVTDVLLRRHSMKLQTGTHALSGFVGRQAQGASDDGGVGSVQIQDQ